MSKPMIWSSPAIAAVRAAPTMPPAGPGQDRVLALEAGGVGQAAVRLHEIEPHAGKLGGDLIDIAAQDRREIGIDHGGVAARDQPQQRADRMAGGDLREAGLAREFGQAAFMLGIFPGVHQHDGAGADARRRARRRRPARAACFVQWLDLLAIDADAAGDLDDLARTASSADVIARSNSRGRAWLPMRSASAKPRLTTSRVRSPLRSSSALVATVVPIFTASTTPGGIGASSGTPSTVLMPAIAASR